MTSQAQRAEQATQTMLARWAELDQKRAERAERDNTPKKAATTSYQHTGFECGAL